MGVPPYCSSCESQQRLPPAVMLMMRSVRQTVSYCSKDCQRAHRKQHKPHCQAVRDLVESIGSGSTITTSADQNERGSSVGANDQGPDEEAETSVKMCLFYILVCQLHFSLLAHFLLCTLCFLFIKS
mmetsp:Transcript_5774/g.11759  ORF Transcript_5774/g.11759 Transcript_5774/m.11759 type:complete len:127 (-) Transcript_5774:1067-1447(-)